MKRLERSSTRSHVSWSGICDRRTRRLCHREGSRCRMGASLHRPRRAAVERRTRRVATLCRRRVDGGDRPGEHRPRADAPCTVSSRPFRLSRRWTSGSGSLGAALVAGVAVELRLHDVREQLDRSGRRQRHLEKCARSSAHGSNVPPSLMRLDGARARNARAPRVR